MFSCWRFWSCHVYRCLCTLPIYSAKSSRAFLIPIPSGLLSCIFLHTNRSSAFHLSCISNSFWEVFQFVPAFNLNIELIFCLFQLNFGFARVDSLLIVVHRVFLACPQIFFHHDTYSLLLHCIFWMVPCDCCQICSNRASCSSFFLFFLTVPVPQSSFFIASLFASASRNLHIVVSCIPFLSASAFLQFFHCRRATALAYESVSGHTHCLVPFSLANSLRFQNFHHQLSPERPLQDF